MKSKCKGFCSSSYFCVFFLGLGGAFFFLVPYLFYYSNLFSSSFFLFKYYYSSFNLSPTFSLSFRFHFSKTFLPSKAYYLTVLILYSQFLQSAKLKSDFFKNYLVLMNQAFSSKLVNLLSMNSLALACTLFFNQFTIYFYSYSPHFFFLAFLTQSALILSTSYFLAFRSSGVSVIRGSLKGIYHISSSFREVSTYSPPILQAVDDKNW